MSSLSDTMLKLRADQDRNEVGAKLLSPKSWVYLEDPPEPTGMSGCRSGATLVQVLVGPVIGTVTQTTAVVLLEVDISAAVAIVLRRRDAPAAEAPRRLQRRLPARTPLAFHVEGLEPGTTYDVNFEGLAACELEDVLCTVHTLPPPDEIRELTVVAMSCDKPWSLDAEMEQNPWERMAEIEQSADKPLVFLHLGDQVYTSEGKHLQKASRMLDDHDRMPPTLAAKVRGGCMDRLQDAYRNTWTEDATKAVLAKGQRMLIWSDNDVASDFTVLKDESGQQVYHPELLKCGMRCYRRYQRQLWDPAGEGALPVGEDPVEEWQFRSFGRLGVFLVDMRGNRITNRGQVVANPIMSERQRNAFVSALHTPGMTGLIVASELPFVQDSPAEVRQKLVADPSMACLTEHWPYNAEELVWLLEQVFEWKAAERGREVLMLGGDSHVAVESLIHDRKTAAQIRHITTSPVTGFTKPFRSEFRGEVGPRFMYEHTPRPRCRNYCHVTVRFAGDGACSFDARLELFQAKQLPKMVGNAPWEAREGKRALNLTRTVKKAEHSGAQAPGAAEVS